MNDGEIVKYKQCCLAAPESLQVIHDFPPVLAAIGRNFPGEMTVQQRSMKVKGLIEQAVVYIANSPERVRPKILGCTNESVIQALGDCASLDLSLNRATGEAALVPYGNILTLMPMYRGFVRLMMRTGKVASIQGECVYRGEPFKITGGTQPHIDHEIRLDVDRVDSNIVGVYAIIHNLQGPPTWAVMGRKEIDAIKAKSMSGDKGPWGYWYGEMAKKSAIRRARKTVDMSADDIASKMLLRAEELDNADYSLQADTAKQTLLEAGKERRKLATAPLPPEAAPGARQPDDDPEPPTE